MIAQRAVHDGSCGITVVGEAAHRGDRLLREIEFGRRVLVLNGAIRLTRRLTNAIDLLVGLSAVEVALLTRAWDRPANRSRIPRADATNVAQATMGLLGKLRHVPARHNSLVTVTCRATDTQVKHLRPYVKGQSWLQLLRTYS